MSFHDTLFATRPISSTRYGWFVVVVMALPRMTVAQTLDAEPAQVSSVETARTGAASPLLLDATLGSQGALITGNGGYDTARSAALFDSAAEVRVWGPIALRAGVIYSEDTRRMRPSVGARVQFLRQAVHGVDGTLSSFFKTEGFNETEGEIETTLAIGRRFEQVYLLGNIAYGQDPEGNDRDGELRAAVLHPRGRAVLGLEARGRSAIGAQHGTNSVVEPRLDVVGGAVGMMTVSSFVLFAEVGPSAFKLQGTDLRWGVASLGGVCAVF
jgi:hypothetical protein